MEKTMNQKISQALLTLRPGAEWTLRGDDYSDLEWHDEKQTPPTWAEVEAEINNPSKPTAEIKREAALAKLAALGLDEDDLKALGL